MKKRKTRGQRPGPRELKKKKQSVTTFFGMVAMCGGDDTFIAPKTFQLFDNILEQSKVWSKSILFHEGLASQCDKSKTPIDLSSHLSNSYTNPYLFPTRFNGKINKDKLINELKLACLQSGFHLVIRSGKKVIEETNSIYNEYVSLVCQCN